MPYKKLEIEDDSDCATCTQRHTSDMEMLSSVKVQVLQDVMCQECGRTINIIVEAEGEGGD